MIGTLVATADQVKKHRTLGVRLGGRAISCIYTDYPTSPYYDSTIEQLIVHGRARKDCTMHKRHASAEYAIGGIIATIPLHQTLLANPDIQKGAYDVHWLEKFMGMKNPL